MRRGPFSGSVAIVIGLNLPQVISLPHTKATSETLQQMYIRLAFKDETKDLSRALR
jgi:hypothetical protein